MRASCRLFLFSLAALLPLSAAANVAMAGTWLTLCPPGVEQVAADQQRDYLQISGERRSLALSSQPNPACVSRSLDLRAEQVRWFGLIPKAKAAWLQRGVILQGLERDQGIQISEVVVSTPAALEQLAQPLSVNLLDRFNLRVYGVEERASLNNGKGGLELRCAAGERPAGVVLRNDAARLPSAIDVEVVIRYGSNASFGLGYADEVTHLLAAPKQLGLLDAGSAQAAFPLPGVGPTSPDRAGTFTLACPQSGGQLTLADLQLQPSTLTPVPSRSIWIWRPAEWLDQPAALLSELEALAVEVAYVSVPIDSGRVRHSVELARFIRQAHEIGVDVWAVEGDPHAVLPEGQTAFQRRAAALAAFNADQAPDGRLSGVQYDIEPYLLPDFALHTEDWLRAYVLTIAGLNEVLTVPLEVAVPFWWSSLELDGGMLLDALAPHVQGLNVMNYRTEAEQLQQFAEPFLAWGAAHQVPVRIALEAGPIADEQRWHFRSDAEAGTLWHLQLGDAQVLLLLHEPEVITGASGYRFVRASSFSGSKLTFRGDRARMDRLMLTLEGLWSAWPSFAGLALHEYRLE